MVVKFNFFAIGSILYVSFNFKVLVFLEDLPHFGSGDNEIFFLLKAIFKQNIEMSKITLKAGDGIRILVKDVLVDFG